MRGSNDIGSAILAAIASILLGFATGSALYAATLFFAIGAIVLAPSRTVKEGE